MQVYARGKEEMETYILEDESFILSPFFCHHVLLPSKGSRHTSFWS